MGGKVFIDLEKSLSVIKDRIGPRQFGHVHTKHEAEGELPSFHS